MTDDTDLWKSLEDYELAAHNPKAYRLKKIAKLKEEHEKMATIEELEKDVQRAQEALAYANRMLAEEKAGFSTEDGMGNKLNVLKHKLGPVYVKATSAEGHEVHITLNPFMAQGLLRYLARQLGYNL